MKVLLPVASLDDAKLIVDFVANYHWPPESTFKLVHVVGACETEEIFAAEQENALKLLEEVTNKLKSILPSAEVVSEVINGPAVYEIVEAASNWKANMIVMGYRTRPLEHFVPIGSVSNGVVTRTPCSVAIIRPPVNAYNPQARFMAESNQTSPRRMA